MTTAWTLVAMNEAAAKHQFIPVTALGLPRVNITDAHSIWMRSPNVVFQTGYRIVGTPEDITAALSAMGVLNEDIQDLLASAITANNYNTTMAEVYKDELESYNEWTRAVVKSNTDSPGAKLFDVMAVVNPDVLHKVRVTKEARALGVPAREATRARATKSLYERLTGLDQGKVLDVSKLEPDGTGARTIDPPTRSRKFGSPDLPIVSADLEHYIMAINMLPGGQTQYATQIEYVRQLFERGRAPTTAMLAVPGTQFRPQVPQAPRVPQPTQAPQVTQATQMQPIQQVPRPLGQMFEGTAIPQTEQIVPTRVYPLFTKRQREKRREAELATKGLPQAIIPAPTQLPTTTPFPTTTLLTTPITFEDDEDEDEDEDDFPEEFSDEELSEDEDSPELVQFQVPIAAPIQVPQLTRTPTVPTVTVPQAPRIPPVPTVTIPTAPQAPRIPPVPTVPQAPRTPTVPTVTMPTVPQAPRTPPVPTVTIPTVPRTPTVPQVPRAPGVPIPGR